MKITHNSTSDLKLLQPKKFKLIQINYPLSQQIHTWWYEGKEELKYTVAKFKIKMK